MAGFLVFGRSRYDEPLQQVGRLDEEVGTSSATAAELARDRFADGLIELSLVPEADITWVMRHEPADG